LDAAYLGITPSRLNRMEPREVYALMEGDRLRWSNLAELFAWGIWQIVLSIPFSNRGDQGGRHFTTWLKRNTPPFFIPPNQR